MKHAVRRAKTWALHCWHSQSPSFHARSFESSTLKFLRVSPSGPAVVAASRAPEVLPSISALPFTLVLPGFNAPHAKQRVFQEKTKTPQEHSQSPGNRFGPFNLARRLGRVLAPSDPSSSTPQTAQAYMALIFSKYDSSSAARSSQIIPRTRSAESKSRHASAS